MPPFYIFLFAGIFGGINATILHFFVCWHIWWHKCHRFTFFVCSCIWWHLCHRFTFFVCSHIWWHLFMYRIGIYAYSYFKKPYSYTFTSIFFAKTFSAPRKSAINFVYSSSSLLWFIVPFAFLP